MRKYHFIYQITSIINGKFYIGIHSTDTIEDGYMGSGSLLQREIQQFGVKNFEREILFHFDNRQDALNKEAEIVCMEFISNPLTYNLVIGGNNGIKTTKEKAIYFNRSGVPPLRFKNIPFEPYDPEFKTVFTLETPIVFKRWKNKKDPLTAFRNEISEGIEKMQNEIMVWITNAYNNKFTHDGGLRLLAKANRKAGYAGNILTDKVKWDNCDSSCDKSVIL